MSISSQNSLDTVFVLGSQVDIWEALRAAPPQRPTTPLLLGEEERQLQRYYCSRNMQLFLLSLQ